MAPGEPGRAGLSANVTAYVDDFEIVTARLPQTVDRIVRIADTKWECATRQAIVQACNTLQTFVLCKVCLNRMPYVSTDPCPRPPQSEGIQHCICTWERTSQSCSLNFYINRPGGFHANNKS
ncbi:hypothetical protein DPMN_003978 [Dreissena polymorpha]|uniref:Uncharacterized protein n=1 Tax=Dreissena polymorpha TaxID=45954 RepID=A0A9D4RSK3_DREPO|nr:hypothetical protein DPMN_003978 [Dreissena polymorpha]